MKTKKGIVITIAVIVIVVLGLYFTFRNKGTSYQFVTVQQGTITEVVSVTGNTTPVQSLDMAFESGGTIAQVNDQAGASVNPGDVVVRLDTSALEAQLAQAQATVAQQTAQLASLQAGAQPADIQSSQAALAGAQQTLANMYANIPTTLTDALAKSNDAVRNQLAPFFTNPETNNPQLTFAVNNSQVLSNVVSDRVNASTELNNWQNELTVLTNASTTPTSTLITDLQNGIAHITIINNLLTDASEAIIDATSLPTGTISAYKTNLTTALTEVGSASTEVNSAIQGIASQNITVQQLADELALKVAGSTPQQIQVQQALVTQAQANVQGIQVSIANASLSSPITGVITEQDAKVGEIASPGETMFSIISNNNLEIDADVPETDIGKVNVGDPVTMTFDAFPGQTFTGKVFYIDPAQTIIGGVVDYLVKVSFDAPNTNIKSGLTANLSINTQTDNNAMILPQFAVIQNTSGTFVEVLQNGAVVQQPVTLGIQDQNGNVEIASGTTPGEQVINIGLKQ